MVKDTGVSRNPETTTSFPDTDGSVATAIPAQIGSYRVIAPLARQGAQAQVFRAVHPGLGRDVVLKLCRTATAEMGVDDKDRLVEEGRILAALKHPHLVQVYDLGWEGDHAFLVMEYVRGQSLDQYARQHGLTGREIARLLAQVARALAEAHKHGILHQDIKPSNILVDDADQARLLDFGLARWRHIWRAKDGPEHVVGTVAFMPPEMARGELHNVGPRSDLFGLGATLFFLLTGRPPFQAATFTDTLEQSRQGRWKEPIVMEGDRTVHKLWLLCSRLLAAAPEERPTSASSVAAELEDIARVSAPVWPILLGSGLFIALGLALWYLYLKDSQRVPSGSAPVAAQVAAKASLSVRVHRDGTDGDFTNLAPLRIGDEVRIEAPVPAGNHATLFLLTTQGQWQELAVRTATPERGTLRFPAEQEKVVPVKGSGGTEILLVCFRRAQPVRLAELQSWLTAEAPPPMRSESVLELGPDGVEALNRTRDFGAPRERVDGEVHMVKRLRTWQTQLFGKVDGFGALAFVIGQ
jgi:eukaryotic-like serine/threonine-protein kinase